MLCVSLLDTKNKRAHTKYPLKMIDKNVPNFVIHAKWRIC